MKAIILTRVSTEEQREAGNSLPAQLLRLEKYLREKGFVIYKTFTFDESAWKKERKEFKNIMEILKDTKEKMVLCCDKIDRLIRNFTNDLVTLEELRKDGKIELHFPSDNIILHKDSPATDLFRFTIGVSLAKYYSDSISDNVKRGNEAKIKKGEWIGWAPVGYLNVEDNKENTNIIVDPVRSHFVIKMFELYATGNYSFRKIKEEMDKVGLKSKSKNPKPLSISMVSHTLTNPFYFGMMRIKGELHPHKYPPLITKHLFDKVQAVSAGWHKKPFKYASKPYVLRGMMKCANCGCTITPETSKGHNYYSCTNFRKMHDKRVYVKEEDILESILKLLENIKLPDEKITELTEDLKQTTKAQNIFFTNTVRELRNEYDKLENRISNLADDKYDRSITDDFYNKKFKEYSSRQAKIMEQLNMHDKADKNYYITANTILNLAKKALEIFESSEPQEKRQLLNFVLQNLELRDKKLEYKLKAPFDTVLLANNCSNLLPIKHVFRTLDWSNIQDELTLFLNQTKTENLLNNKNHLYTHA
jgi:DNA invertase Pin-like site-specific DNA recombinase